MRPDIKSTQLGGIANLALMAPVRSGFIPGADTYTYAKRLEVMFKTLNAIRLGARESAKFQNPLPDALGRWGILHSFRYALIPPEIGSDGEAKGPEDELSAGVFRLYLNVTFDGGWEPYMRVIYRDLGPLLDLIFGNCDGYTPSATHTYDEYIRWVRRQEIPVGLFYTDSSMSVLDQRYLEAVERIQRHEPDPARAREMIAGLSLKAPPDVLQALGRFAAADEQTQEEVLRNNLRALKGLYDLRALYPANARHDDDCLLRFSRGSLPEFRAFVLLRRDQLAPYREQIDWLLQTPPPVVPEWPGGQKPDGPAAFDESEIQAGILTRFVGVTHGCLLLLAVTDPAKARQWIGKLRTDTEQRQKKIGSTLHWNIAFSPQGLRAIGQSAEALDIFPQEFIDGMEARAGLLGDVRGNHPEHWRRPRFKGREIDIASVHVVVQYRLVSNTDLDKALHPILAQLANDVDGEENGLRLLSTEAMRSYPNNENITTEHFGFQDGFSQPTPRPDGVDTMGPAAFDDTVAAGELFMGHPTDRNDHRFPAKANPVMDNGSFLVIRKLRQHLPRWRGVLRDAALVHDPQVESRTPAEQEKARTRIASMMMGRQPDGTPVLDPELGSGNDFNYDADPAGSRCPFQSHIRRANPRTLADGKRKTPRLVRRGMSYGPRWETDATAERGLYFMAYCGSIAEQFEVIQRWIAGGNSSGTLASHSDPMLGVPQKGVPRSFQWLGPDGKVERVDLGDEPLAELEWGVYLFAPSTIGLTALTVASKAPSSQQPDTDPPPAKASDFDRCKRLIQGTPRERDLLWKSVRDKSGGDLQTDYGRLVSKTDKAMGILKDNGTSHSVCGYGRRFEKSVGPGYLGMDPAKGHTRLAETSGINQAIVDITEEKAFEAAREETRGVLALYAPGSDGSGQESPVDVVRLSERVIAALYRRWFGLPDRPEKHMRVGFAADRIVDMATDQACCPRDFFYVARYTFGPHPSQQEIEKGTLRGQAIRRAVKSYVESTKPGDLVDLSKKIYDKLVKTTPTGLDCTEVIDTIGGVMVGFGPSVHLHYVNVMREWVEVDEPDTPSIWDLQTRLLAEDTSPSTSLKYEQVRNALRAPLIKQMCREPVPSVIWRETPGPEPVPPDVEPAKTVVGLHGMMADADAEALMFGGSRNTKSPLHTIHACPGHGMATGVLLGIISTLLLSGTLRRTPSTTILTLVR